MHGKEREGRKTYDECGRHVEGHDGGDLHVLGGILDGGRGGHGSRSKLLVGEDNMGVYVLKA